MKCPNCDAETPAHGRFCTECGTRLPRRCPSCGEATTATAKFCAECGTPLTPETGAAHAPPTASPPAGAQAASVVGGALAVSPPPLPRPAPGTAAGPTPGPVLASEPGADALVADAERRHLTVLFADLVDSTPLAARVDVEDLREVVGAYMKAAETVIVRYEGWVANTMGDGVLAYFGYPRAHEDDARRACLAGLDMVGEVRKLNTRFQAELGIELGVRVGIHTGPTLVATAGAGAAQEGMAVGETLNLAARLQTFAEPGTVVISGTTERLVRGFVTCASLGSQALKGIAEPVELWRVVRPSGAADRMAAAAAGELSELVGRDAELQVLHGRWAEARAGRSRVVLLRGDAGLGKSRLVREFRDQLGEDELDWLECRCSSLHVDSALRPIVDMTPALFGFAEADDAPARIRRMEALADRVGLRAEAVVPLLAALLDIPVEGSAYAPPDLSAQIQRQRTLHTLADLVARVAALRPVVLVVADVHYVDQSTLEFLELLIEHAATAPLLMLLVGRTDLEASLPAHAEIVLRRLPPDLARDLVLNLTGQKPLPPGLLEQILERADGNPLYLEELTRAALESGQLAEGDVGYELVTAGALAIPASLQESLMARLDRIAPAKTVIQVGAAIGRQFRLDVLRGVLRLDEAALGVELDRLVGAGILVRRGGSPATYGFKHALLQDAAYQSMTRKLRRACHARIAAVLGEAFGDTAPEVMAHHHAEAGHAAEAADHWYRAGLGALGAFALAESVNHLERGLAVVASMAEGPERLVTELRLQVALGVPLMLRHGFASAQVAAHYRQLHDLCEEVGEAGREQLFPAYWGLWTYHEVSAQYAQAEAMGRRLFDLADASGDDGIRLGAHIAFGAARLMRGDLAAARAQFELGLALYDPDRHAPLAMLFGQDGGAMCASFLTWVHAHEGQEEQGRERATQALTWCEQPGQYATRGFVEAVLASFHCLLGDFEAGEAHARRVIALGVERGMPHWEAQGHLNLGWALQGLGRAEEAIPHFARGLEGFELTGTRAALTYFKGALAEAELRRGRPAAAGAVLDELDAFMAESDERFYQAELCRLRGHVAHARDEPDAAAAAFDRAREIAEHQGAHAFRRRADESRATMIHA